MDNELKNLLKILERIDQELNELDYHILERKEILKRCRGATYDTLLEKYIECRNDKYLYRNSLVRYLKEGLNA